MKKDWTYKKLGEVTTKICDGSHNPPHGVEYSKYPMLSSKNIFFDRYDYESPRYLSKEDFEIEDKRTNVSDGDVLLTIVGTVGRTCCVMAPYTPFTLQRSVAVLKPKKEMMLSRFLMYSLHSLSALWETEAKGVAQKGVYLKQVANIQIPIPSLDEQQQIVAELDLLNGMIEKQKTQIEELDKLSQSIFYDMFGDPVTNDKGWEVKKLGYICDVRDGTHDSPKYLISSEYVLITSKNIQGDQIDFSTANYISKEDYDNINKRSYVDDGDIIMAMIGTIGKPIIIKKRNVNFCIKNVALIKFKEKNEVENIYIKGLLDNDSYISYLKGFNKGGTQKFVALGTLRGLLVPVPPLSLQQEFAAKIEAIEAMKAKVRHSLKEAETLFNSRMDYYFN